jgi:excisionase family DNA binding protein
MTDEAKRPVALTPKETAKELRMGINQVYAGIKRGEIPSVTIGNKILVPTKMLDRMFGNG